MRGPGERRYGATEKRTGCATRGRAYPSRIALDEALREELLAIPPGAADADTLRVYGERLWEILDDYEVWPGRHLVGDDGSRAAWLVAQHSIEDVGLQRRCLETLEIAVARNDADPVHLAYLTDRVR